MKIKLSDHFNYNRLLRFTFPAIIMMVFTSLYGVVDGLFVTNFAGKSALDALFIAGFEWGIAIMGPAFFTALNNGLVSAILSFLRTIVFQVVCVILFPIIWGIDGIWISIVAAEGLACICAIGFIIALRKKYGYA